MRFDSVVVFSLFRVYWLIFSYITSHLAVAVATTAATAPTAASLERRSRLHPSGLGIAIGHQQPARPPSQPLRPRDAYQLKPEPPDLPRHASTLDPVDDYVRIFQQTVDRLRIDRRIFERIASELDGIIRRRRWSALSTLPDLDDCRRAHARIRKMDPVIRASQAQFIARRTARLRREGRNEDAERLQRAFEEHDREYEAIAKASRKVGKRVAQARRLRREGERGKRRGEGAAGKSNGRSGAATDAHADSGDYRGGSSSGQKGQMKKKNRSGVRSKLASQQEKNG